MKKNRHYDVIIIGGGVIGIACAYYLAKSGRQVKIIEKETIGAGASHGNCGLVFISDLLPLCSPGVLGKEFIRTVKGASPLYIAPRLDPSFFLWLLRFAGKCNDAHMSYAMRARHEALTHSKVLYDELFSEEDMPCDHENNGILTVFKEPALLEKYHSTNALLEPFGLGGRYVDKNELKILEPAVGNDVAGAWYNPVDRHLRPDSLVRAWKKAARANGVSITENCAVKGFGFKNNKIKNIITDSGSCTADNFVLSAGAWSPEFSKQLGVKLPIQPGKGYSITMERPGICPKIPCYLYEKSVVVTPWKSGYRLGGTMEFSGFNKTLFPQRLGNLKLAAKAYMKEPEGRPIIEEWVGLRPMTYDDLPIIDRAPKHRNLYLATGHGMMGISMAPTTGSLIADLINGKPACYNIKPFSIKRFQ